MRETETELCVKCAFDFRDTMRVTKISKGIDKKVKCRQCGKTRLGGTYKIQFK